MLIFLAASLVSCVGNEPQSSTLPVFEFGATVETFEALYTYEDMEEDLVIFRERFPDIFTLMSGGESHDGRIIYFALFGEADAGKTIMINAGIHGREYLTPLLVMKQLEYYLEHFDTPAEDGKTYRELFKGFRFCVVPMINPDGIAISQFGLDGIRDESLRAGVQEMCDTQLKDADKYLEEWKANAAGVDINRNFGISSWSTLTGVNTKPANQLYKGNKANSEPETQALINITNSLNNLVAAVSYHSQGEIIYWDSGQSGTVRAETKRLADIAAELTGYKLYNKFSSADATYNDWCVLNLKVPSINIETGTGLCPLPISQFETIWVQNKLMWLRVVEGFGG